jgi:hypothetical protein
MESSLKPTKSPTRPWHFWRDLAISLAVCSLWILLSWRGYLLFLSEGRSLTLFDNGFVYGLLWLVMFFLFPVVYLAGPVLVLIYGLHRRRRGFVFGPVGIAVILFLGVAVYLARSNRSHQQLQVNIKDFATPALEAPSRSPAALAFYDLASIDQQLFVRVLAVSPYAVAFSNQKMRLDNLSWTVMRRGAVADCVADANADSVFDFILAGYVGMCATKTTGTGIGDALLYRERTVDKDHPAEDAPRGFSGKIREVVEGINGQERLLGRRVIGSGKGSDQGPKLDPETFAAWALDRTVEQLRAPGPASVPALLDETESYFDRPAVSARAVRVWDSVAQRARGQPDVLQPRIERLLASDEPLRMKVGLSGLYNLKQPDRAFAQDRMVELAFGPLLASPKSPLLEALRPHFTGRRELLPPAVRQRARATLMSDAPLAPSQRQIMFLLLDCGGTAARREAVDTIFSLAGIAFEETVSSIEVTQNNWATYSEPNHWTSEEIDRLNDRAADVPSSRLRSYSDVIVAHGSKQQMKRLDELVRERLSATPLDEKDMASLRGLDVNLSWRLR